MPDNVCLTYNRAVGLLHSGSPSEALTQLVKISAPDEDNLIRFYAMLLYHHIVVSLRSQTPTLDPITRQFQKTLCVPGTTNFIQDSSC